MRTSFLKETKTLTIKKDDLFLLAETKFGYNIANLESLEFAKELVLFCKENKLDLVTIPVPGTYRMFVGYEICLRKLNEQDKIEEPVFDLLNMKPREKTPQEITDLELIGRLDSLLSKYANRIINAED